jgi:hypothetical protein
VKPAACSSKLAQTHEDHKDKVSIAESRDCPGLIAASHQIEKIRTEKSA